MDNFEWIVSAMGKASNKIYLKNGCYRRSTFWFSWIDKTGYNVSTVSSALRMHFMTINDSNSYFIQQKFIDDFPLFDLSILEFRLFYDRFFFCSICSLWCIMTDIKPWILLNLDRALIYFGKLLFEANKQIDQFEQFSFIWWTEMKIYLFLQFIVHILLSYQWVIWSFF